jgi:hypothetical protein
MDEPFEIPVTYKGKEHSFPARIIKYFYIYRLEVDVNGDKILLEPDEQRNYRAIIEEHHHGKIDVQLVQEIIKVIEDVVKE